MFPTTQTGHQTLVFKLVAQGKKAKYSYQYMAHTYVFFCWVYSSLHCASGKNLNFLFLFLQLSMIVGISCYVNPCNIKLTDLDGQKCINYFTRKN